MPTLNDLTSFDLVVVFMALVFLIRGAWIGFMRQLGAFIALVGSYYLAGQYADRILPFTEQWVDNPKLTFLVSFVLVFAVAALVFTLVGKVLQRLLRISLLGWLDRCAGIALGGVKAGVVASLLYMVLASTLSTTNELLRKSFTNPYLKQGAELLQSLIDDPRLRKYFLPKEPAIPPESMPARPGSRKAEPKPAEAMKPEVLKKESAKPV